MFTGIIEAIGSIKEMSQHSDGARLIVTVHFDEKPRLGDSIAINGACMTVCDHVGDNGYCFDVSIESLNRTNLKFLKSGDIVNLERSLKANGRIDGHFVSGHVDSLGAVNRIEINGNDRIFYFGYPANLSNQIVSKGSVTVNGVSLTVIEPNGHEFHVTIVPYTFSHTNFSQLNVGSLVNLETDILAKYVQGVYSKQDNKLTKEFLINAGF